MDDEQLFYLVVLIIAIPAIIMGIRFGLFMTLPKFLLKRYFMDDFTKQREKHKKRAKKEEEKRTRRGG